jgi:outer membrane protein assembly factor BamB
MKRVAAALGALALSSPLISAAPTQAASVSAEIFTATLSTAPDDTARVNGTVYAVAQVGSRTIIAGDFTMVGGQPRHHVAALRPDGRLDPYFKPDVDGVVRTVAGSPDGSTVYIGGLFSTAGGAARANLAAVDAATGLALPQWTADTVGTTPEVLALAVSGSTVYAAGRFGGIDGTTRKRLVALDSAGDVVPSFKPTPSWTVKFVAASPDGSRVYAGGAFDVIGGQERLAGIAELDAATGLATPFNPASSGSLVTAMGISPTADRLYYGVENNEVYSYDVATGAMLWKVKNGGDTQAIAVSDTAVYLGGHFGQNLTQKVKRQWLQSVDLDGRVTSWDPKLGGGSMGVWALATTPTALLVGGEFIYVDGLNKPRFARFSGTP